MARAKTKENNIFIDGLPDDFKKVENKLKRMHTTTIVSSAEIDAVDDDDYFAVMNKFRNSLASGIYKDLDKIPELTMRAKYMYKLAWASGMTTAEVNDHVNKGLGHLSIQDANQILNDARKLLYDEVTNINTGELFRAYAERARRIIIMMEDMLKEIKRYWRDNGFNQDSFQREYTVLLKMVFDAEKEILKLGLELGVVKESAGTKDNILEVRHQLIPDQSVSTKLLDAIMVEDETSKQVR